jgi:hypothetical protein
MWNYDLPTICREHELVILDTAGICAPITPHPDKDARMHKIELFSDALNLADNWRIPYTVFDEMLSRSKRDEQLVPLVDLLKGHCYAFKTNARIFDYLRSRSVEVANNHCIDDFDRVAMLYAIGFAHQPGKKAAYLTGRKRHIDAFFELKNNVENCNAHAHFFLKGKYTPVVEAVKFNLSE